MKTKWLLIVPMLFASCASCDDRIVQTETQQPEPPACEDYNGFNLCQDVAMKIPAKIQIYDEFQQEAIDKINDLFGAVIFEKVDSKTTKDIILEMVDDNSTFEDKTGIAITYTICNFKDNVATEIIQSRTQFISSYYEEYKPDITVEIIAHELFHALGYHHHEPGIMCITDKHVNNIQDLFIESKGLIKWIHDSYGIDPILK